MTIHILNTAAREPVGTMCGLSAFDHECTKEGEIPTCEKCISVALWLLSKFPKPR